MHALEQHRVCVWGAGAVGKLIAASLQAAGIEVTLKVRRAEQISQIRQNGIVLYRQTGTAMTVPMHVTDDPVSVDARLVIVTVKSFDTRQAAKEIAAIQTNPLVLSLQNGIGNGEQLAEILTDKRIFTAVTTYGATSLSDFEVAERGEGELVIGAHSRIQQQNNEELAAYFSKAGLYVRIGHNMQQEVWKKALVNIGINPVTAIYRVTNGQVGVRPELRQLAANAVTEAEAVALAAGILPADSAGQGVTRMLQVCRQTAANRSSMLQDIEKGGRTEIDALNGRIVQLGEACAINTPVNRHLLAQIKSLEQNSSF